MVKNAWVFVSISTMTCAYAAQYARFITSVGSAAVSNTAGSTARATVVDHLLDMSPGGKRMPTPVDVGRLKLFLTRTGLDSKYQWVIDGFRDGFDICINENVLRLFQKRDRCPAVTGKHVICLGDNLTSARDRPEVVQKKLDEETQAGRVLCPFTDPPLRDFIVSPIGVVPKKVPNKFRMIHHLSYPQKGSVNDAIDAYDKTVGYPTVDDAIEMILETGEDVWLGKTDIEAAFRIVPVLPKYYRTLGMMWDGKYFYDRCLPMGCATSCKIFAGIGACLMELFERLSKKCRVLNMLDDFLFIGASEQDTREGMACFLQMCTELGVPIASQKTEGPAKCLSFLGIEIDTTELEVRLPPGKLEDYVASLNSARSLTKIKCGLLQSLTGKLQFACYVVPQGQAFLRRLYDLYGGHESPLKPHHRIRLSKETKEDLRMWTLFFESFNGRRVFSNDLSPTRWLVTDAAGAIGFGLIFGNRWAYGLWPVEWEGMGITFKEMFPVAVTIMTWASELRGSLLFCHSDNTAVVAALNKFSSRCKHTMMLVRRVALACLQYDIRIRASHVPGKENILADALSRLQIQRFHELAARDGWTLAPRRELVESRWMDSAGWKLESCSQARDKPTDGHGDHSLSSW